MNTQHFDQAAPHWDSAQYRVQRAQSIAQQIMDSYPVQQKSVLDFGCGTGLLGFHFAPNAQNVTFADTSQGMLDQVQLKAQSLGLQNVKTQLLEPSPIQGSFDLIVTLMALHHIPDYAAAIQQMASHLHPGGALFLCDLDTEDGSFHGESKVPHNGFLRSDLEKILHRAGLKQIQSKTGHVDYKVIDGKRHEYPIFIINGIH